MDELENMPVRICPHVPPGVVYIMQDPPPCPLCEEDVVREAEQIKDA